MTATVTFVDLDGTVVGTHTTTYQAGTTVRFIYPGASVDAAGNPSDWPGWVFDGDEWVVDPTDAFLRDGLTVVVEVNPTASDTVSYPPATPTCTANPPTDPPPGTPPGTLAHPLTDRPRIRTVRVRARFDAVHTLCELSVAVAVSGRRSLLQGGGEQRLTFW